MAKKSRSKRRRLSESGGSYFATPTSSLQFIHTGATPFDCVVGGGWPLGRTINIVGDKSTGKTLLAIEAMSNFARAYTKGRIRYREPEACFIDEYAAALGMPIERVEFSRKDDPDPAKADTVENFHRDLKKFIKSLDGDPGLYILDSLDALSDEGEVGREVGEASYGTGKAKGMSEFFRKINNSIEASNICLIIISQTRQNIGVTFGRKYTRSGGSALDFYAAIIVYLAHVGEIRRTVNKVKRTVGVKVKARCTKNKIGLPFRDCEFPIIFAYGIEDITASLDWLKQNGCMSLSGMTLKDAKELRAKALKVDLTREEIATYRKSLSKAVKRGWREVETSFLPKQGKYTDD